MDDWLQRKGQWKAALVAVRQVQHLLELVHVGRHGSNSDYNSLTRLSVESVFVRVCVCVCVCLCTLEGQCMNVAETCLCLLTTFLHVEWLCRELRSGGERWEESHRDSRLERVGGWG